MYVHWHKTVIRTYCTIQSKWYSHGSVTILSWICDHDTLMIMCGCDGQQPNFIYPFILPYIYPFRIYWASPMGEILCFKPKLKWHIIDLLKKTKKKRRCLINISSDYGIVLHSVMSFKNVSRTVLFLQSYQWTRHLPYEVLILLSTF